MKTIVILGAAGRFGEAAANAFLKAGWRVRGVARGAKTATLIKGVEPVQADAFDREALIRACEGADVILHALNPRYDEWATKILPLGENIVAAAKATGATIMVPGNVYNYGHRLGLDMDETTSFEPREDKGRFRVALETMLEAAAKLDGVRTIMVRGGDFFGGKRAETWFDLMILKDLNKGKFAWPGKYDTVHAFAYLPDFAEAFVQVAEKRDELPDFACLNFEGHTATGADFLAAAERVAGKKLKAGGAPWPLLRLVGLVNPVMREVVKMKYLWDVPHSLSGAKLEGLTGPVRKTPIDLALASAVEDLRLL